MKNKLLTKGSMLFAFMAFFAMTHSMNAQSQYCVPEGTNAARHINNFSTTLGSENISNLNSGYSTAGYGDFYDTHTVAQSLDSSVDFSVDILGGTAGFRIWVDWNQDGVFDVTNEVAYNSSSYAGNHTGSITVPSNAVEGETRMRIVSHWLSSSGTVDPCATAFEYGEFEDYKFNVIYPDACTGTPDAGIAMLNPTSGNPGTTYSVSAQGYTVATEMSFQWQSNTNSEGWEDQGDATGLHTPYTATAPLEIGDEVEWRLALTCVASGETSLSDSATFATVLTYCTATSSTVEPITRVLFAGIDNVSPATSSIAYEDFTSIVAEVERDATFSFTAEGNTSGNFTNHFTVWVDWNANGEFETTEMYEIGSIINSTGTDGKQATNDITVPSDAVSGEVRMRVRKNFSSSLTNPCGSNSYGQTEDYTVNVSGGGVDPFPAPYCEIADAAEVVVEEITKVEFAGTSIINEDFTSVLVDKTDVVVNVTSNETYTISVEGNTNGDFETNIVAFIDWNQNGILDDAGEVYELGTLENSTGDDGISVSMDIAVPADAVLGQTRVRITKTYFDDFSDPEINPCGIEFNPFGQGIFPGFGQALDFTVEVEEAAVEVYCIPVLDCTDNDMITNVTFQEIDNTTTCSPDGYADYTAMVATVESGGTYPISVSVGDGWASESVSIWIDYDNNGVFDENEFLYLGTGSDEALTGEITIPAGVADGNYRMRVRVAADGQAGTTWDLACDETQAYGETEDYTLSVSEVTIVYCIPELDCTDNDMITNVTFQEIDNTTTCSPDGYGDYTSMVATVESGGTYPISVSVGDGWPVESVSVWIDFNNNGTFDENEFYFIGTGSDETLTGDISIPAGVADGNYRMRVRVAPDSNAPWDYSCDDLLGYGETEDYTLTVDGIAGVNDYSASNFTYYPNPMENVLNIAANKNIESVSAFNLLGQQVISNVNFTNGKVDVSSLPTGTFVFRVTFEGGQIENFKVLKK